MKIYLKQFKNDKIKRKIKNWYFWRNFPLIFTKNKRIKEQNTHTAKGLEKLSFFFQVPYIGIGTDLDGLTCKARRAFEHEEKY